MLESNNCATADGGRRVPGDAQAVRGAIAGVQALHITVRRRRWRCAGKACRGGAFRDLRRWLKRDQLSEY